MARALLIAARLHDGRYHGCLPDGSGEWPPSPARLFQALVAGVGSSGPLGEEESKALMWLEKRGYPLIGAPMMREGQRVMFYMPNNDLDALGGDSRRIAEIRTAKPFRPRMFDATIPFLYAWSLDEDEESEFQSRVICALAERLYQFGRGIDMAWAWGEVLADDELEARLLDYSGRIYRPSGGDNGTTLTCPESGSLESLKNRYSAHSERFKTEGMGRGARQRFSQPPKPRFARVAYESPPSRRVYELRDPSSVALFAMWPLAQASKLVVQLRDEAADRLRQALPARSADIDRVLIGRKPDGANEGPATARVRIVPLPSIGHHHADGRIRRVLVEVPAGCPLQAENVRWAFSGLELCDSESREVLAILTPAADVSMLAHYGLEGCEPSHVWRTVIPAALPESAKRRRIDPMRMVAEAKGGAERAAEQARAAGAVVQALRHAEVRARVEAIRVQREPFEAKGERVEAFAPGTRFAKERLWHVEVTFAAPIQGPLVIGDGRFLGLGVMAPAQVDAVVVEGELVVTPSPESEP